MAVLALLFGIRHVLQMSVKLCSIDSLNTAIELLQQLGAAGERYKFVSELGHMLVFRC